MRGVGEIVVAIGLVWIAWRTAAELFIAWYSGVDPDLTWRQRVESVVLIGIAVAGALLLVLPTND